jgi:beta-glucanase (GH16 family)
MIKIYLILIFLISSISISAQKYVQVWGDEFNTPGLPDSTKWTFEKGKLRNNELQYYTVKRLENCRIEDSVLIIETRKEKYEGADYTSADIISRGIGDWKYGKFEIRAKVPGGKGTWPAIWMMPTYETYGGWPRSGELDIMEYIGVEPQNFYFTTHFEGINSNGHGSNGSGPQKVVRNPYNEFITFVAIWTPEKIEWWANDRKIHEYKKPADDYRVWPFDKEFYMILNLAYGGTWGGYDGVDDTKLPHQFQIDYVRVYQLQDGDGPFSLNVEQAEGGSVEISPKLDTYPEGTEVTLTATPDSGYTFEAWKHNSRANPYTFKVVKNTIITPKFKDQTQLLTNGTFDETTAPWNLYINNANNVSYTMGIEDGKLMFNITKSPGVDWHFGFQELGFAMLKGKYKLSFDAYADQAKTIGLSISKNYVDWGSIVSRNIPITTTNKHYELDLEMPRDDENVRLYFGIGQFTGKFYIDNIRLSPIHSPTALTQTSKNNETLIYPNPTKGVFTVQLSNIDVQKEAALEMFSLDGKLIYQTRLTGLKTEIDAGQINPGIYLIKVISGADSQVSRLIFN